MPSFITAELLNELYMQLELIGRCVLASICGALIGVERKNRFKEAGLRTHLIVALGSALMMVVSKYGFFDVLEYATNLGFEIKLDPSRLASNIITGIGFLGAGTIFVRKQIINGLTTAAGLWATAGIGMAIGAGMYAVGIVITLYQILAQIFLHKNLKMLRAKTSDLVLIKVEDSSDAIKKINDILTEKGVEISSIKYEKVPSGLLEVECFLKFPKKYGLIDVAADLKAYDFIKSVDL